MRILILILLLSIHAFAAKEVGNGGDVVVCKSPAGQLSYELLDYYEARVMRGIDIDLNSFVVSDERVLAHSVLKRLEKINPGRMKFYANLIEEFFESHQLLTGVNLVDVPDSQHVFLPTGCYIQQAIIQREPGFPEDKKYIIDGDLWKSLDLVTKAGLILHEVIYRESLMADQQTSIYARYFNSYLAGNKIQSMVFDEYLKFVKLSRLPDIEFKGINLLLCKPLEVNGEIKNCGRPSMFEWNGTALDAEVVPPWAPWAKPSQEPPNEYVQQVEWQDEFIPLIGEISWHHEDNGGGVRKFTKLYIVETDAKDKPYNVLGADDWAPECRKLWNCKRLASWEAGNDEPHISFMPDGRVESYVPSDNPTFQVGKWAVRCQRGYRVSFADDGKLKACNLDGVQHFSDEQFNAWSQGWIFFSNETVAGLTEIESGHIYIHNMDGTSSVIYPTDFGVHDGYHMTVKTKRSWTGKVMDQAIEFGPGTFTFEGYRLCTFALDQSQNIHFPHISDAALKISYGVIDLKAQLLQEFVFEGQAALRNQAGAPTVYLGPGNITLLWKDGFGHVDRCRTTQGSQASCPTYTSNEGE